MGGCLEVLLMGNKDGDSEVGEKKKAGWHNGKFLSAFFPFFFFLNRV